MELLQYLTQRISVERNTRKRAALREDLMKAIINSYPEQTPISIAELGKILQYPKGSSGPNNMLARLIAKGEISRQELPNGYGYKVLVPGNTYDKERGTSYTPQVQQAKLVEDMDNAPEVTEDLEDRIYTFEELEALAMKHEFYNPGDSVAEFINTLKEK